MKEDIILKIENVSKQYRLGLIGTGTISHDLNRWWHKIRGKEDPFLKIGDTNDRSTKGNSNYVWALKDLNFEVKRGEVLGIIGKNGAGKSTLLKILSQVTSPTTGGIRSKGRIAALLEVGTGFHPEMTGKENIFLNGAILGMTKKEIASKLDEIISFSGCERYIDTPVKRYSSGMKVRLAFAVAAYLEPDVLVVDEVLAVGDAEFQKKAIGKMKDISNEDGRTVLFVSHDMLAIQNLCNRTLVLSNGELAYIGSTTDAITYYLSQGITKLANDSSFSLTLADYFAKSSKVKLKTLKIYDSELGYGNKILSLGNGRFEISFETTIEEVATKVEAAITIKDLFNNPLLTYSTTFRRQVLEKEKEDKVICSFNSINLIPGKYKIHIWFLINTTELSIIENSGEIEIVDNNIFGSGVLPNLKNHGPILTDQFKWK
ncbi:MAG: ATP-binding cassette domain-containing protein [Flavobacteriaceae bacterium]|nr:ATP-binding cassette domain-containing protein [Flavobacteriaceae bacterium]